MIRVLSISFLAFTLLVVNPTANAQQGPTLPSCNTLLDQCDNPTNGGAFNCQTCNDNNRTIDDVSCSCPTGSPSNCVSFDWTSCKWDCPQGEFCQID